MISEVLENRVIWTVNDTENTHRQKDDVDESVHKKKPRTIEKER